MASRLFWRRMPRRVTCRWLLRRNRTQTTHVTGQWLFRRKRTQRTRMTPDFSSFPDEINEQILLKLQCIKSIVTCTSVCKSWYALIKSNRFITMHLSRPNSNTEYFLCSYYHQRYYSIENYNGERLENYYDFIFPAGRMVTVHGSCNGLICYTKFNDVSSDIYLWNPTIRKLKTLPKSIYYTKHTAYGFCYDTNSDDYKVVKISCTKISKVEVYSLNSNSWDIITTSGPKFSNSYFDNGVHFNGTMYWRTCESENWRIVSLNIKNGMFRDTLLICPAEERMPRFVLNMLGDRSRSLFVLRDTYTGMGIHLYDESLNELYRNELEKNEKETLLPLGVRNNGNEVLFQKIGTDPPILVFNIGELKFKEFCPSTKTIHSLIPFVETLVLLDDGDSNSTPNAR